MLKFTVEFAEHGHYYKHGSGLRPPNLQKIRSPVVGWSDRMRNPLYRIKRCVLLRVWHPGQGFFHPTLKQCAATLRGGRSASNMRCTTRSWDAFSFFPCMYFVYIFMFFAFPFLRCMRNRQSLAAHSMLDSVVSIVFVSWQDLLCARLSVPASLDLS